MRNLETIGALSGLALFTLVMSAFSYPFFVNGYRATMARYNIHGDVNGEVQSKMRVNGAEGIVAGEEKFAVPLEAPDGPIIVNCTSTQCGALSEGQRVELSCYLEWHMFVPEEQECRFSRMLR